MLPGVAPSFARLLLGSGPRFLRDAFGATVTFYVGWKLHGLVRMALRVVARYHGEDVACATARNMEYR